MKNRTRKHPIQIYLSDDEYTLLVEKAKISGMKSISSMIRQLIIYSFTYEVNYEDLRSYNVSLGRIGNNLNQIAHIANSCGQIDNKDLQKAKELMEEIWQLQKSMLSKQPLINQ